MNLAFRHYYWRWIKNLFFLLILFVLLLTAARAGFAFVFGDKKVLLSNIPHLVRAMFLGLRFDLIPLAYINAIPFLLLNLMYFVPGKNVIKFTRFLIVSQICIGYLLLLWLYIFDYAFYSYYQDHLNILFFGFFEDDTQAVLVSVWKNYNLILWLAVLSLAHYFFYCFVKFVFSPFNFDMKVRKFDYRVLVVLFAGIILIGFMGRGSFNRLPLSFEDAHICQDEFINKVSLNGVITLNRAIKIRKTYGKDKYNYLKEYGYKNWQVAFQDAFARPAQATLIESLKYRTPRNDFIKSSPPHVVLVVMESFGSYWNDLNGPEFQIFGELQKHLETGVLFPNFLPAENGTIGSIVSVATSQVIRPGARFLSESEFMKTALRSSGHLPYKDAGYDTHFVYGGKLGWRDLGSFLAKQKYDNLWGADEIREAMPELNNFATRDLGNEWGIFDEYLYSFIDEQLRTATRPQFFLVLSTSNHPPFEYPTSYRPLPVRLTKDLMNRVTVGKDLANKRFLGLQYANQKIGEFITRIRLGDSKDKTIIALTGDHSYWIAKGVGLEQQFKRFAVPFFISAPKAYLPKEIDTMKFGSHEDIFPSLYHISLSDRPYFKLGEDIFSEKSHAMNSSGLFANSEGAFHSELFWKWKSLKDQVLETTPETSELKKVKAHGQAMISVTDLYLKEEKLRKPTDAESDLLKQSGP